MSAIDDLIEYVRENGGEISKISFRATEGKVLHSILYLTIVYVLLYIYIIDREMVLLIGKWGNSE